MKKWYEVTREDAVGHFAAVLACGESLGGADAKAHFIAQIRRIREQLTREMSLTGEGLMRFIAEIEPKHGSSADYFIWLEGVLNFQLMYLFLLEHEE